MLPFGSRQGGKQRFQQGNARFKENDDTSTSRLTIIHPKLKMKSHMHSTFSEEPPYLDCTILRTERLYRLAASAFLHA